MQSFHFLSGSDLATATCVLESHVIELRWSGQALEYDLSAVRFNNNHTAIAREKNLINYKNASPLSAPKSVLRTISVLKLCLYIFS